MRITVDTEKYSIIFDGVGESGASFSDVLLDRKDGKPAFSVLDATSRDAATKCADVAFLMQRLGKQLYGNAMTQIHGDSL